MRSLGSTGFRETAMFCVEKKAGETQSHDLILTYYPTILPYRAHNSAKHHAFHESNGRRSKRMLRHGTCMYSSFPSRLSFYTSSLLHSTLLQEERENHLFASAATVGRLPSSTMNLLEVCNNTGSKKKTITTKEKKEKKKETIENRRE